MLFKCLTTVADGGQTLKQHWLNVLANTEHCCFHVPNGCPTLSIVCCVLGATLSRLSCESSHGLSRTNYQAFSPATLSAAQFKRYHAIQFACQDGQLYLQEKNMCVCVGNGGCGFGLELSLMYNLKSYFISC